MRLTIEDGTSEETEELEEQVLLLGGDFVPAVTLTADLNLVGGDTLLDIGLEHLVGDESRVGTSGVARVARAPELPPGLALAGISSVGLGGLGIVSLGISVGRDVLLQSSVLVWSEVSDVACGDGVEGCSPRSSMLPGACDHLRDLSAAPSPPFSISFSPKLTRGAAILDSDAQVNGRYVVWMAEGRVGVILFDEGREGEHF